ncbi:hypothetical protein [Dolichospermum phage Dfl-JY23]
MIARIKDQFMLLWESIKNYLENGTDLKELLVSLDGQPEEVIQLLYGMLSYIETTYFLEDHHEYLLNYLEHQYNLQY